VDAGFHQQHHPVFAVTVGRGVEPALLVGDDQGQRAALGTGSEGRQFDERAARRQVGEPGHGFLVGGCAPAVGFFKGCLSRPGVGGQGQGSGQQGEYGEDPTPGLHAWSILFGLVVRVDNLNDTTDSPPKGCMKKREGTPEGAPSFCRYYRRA
jgi:hypothetical protein